MTRQFSTTGMKYKPFDDGVGMAVEYIRNDSNILAINFIRYYYNLESMEVDYNCSYIDFIHSHPKVRISKNMIDVAPRVRQMMDELESELRSELRSARDEQDRLEAIESELGFTIPRPHKISDLINPDETNFDTMENIEKEAPKHKHTRWELLELD